MGVVRPLAAGESVRQHHRYDDRRALGRDAGDCSLLGATRAIVLVNALLDLPPVVVGLAIYLLLTRSGPLGFAGLLFTPVAM